MSQQTENRLQAALAAKAGGITEGMLRQPRLPERGAGFAGYDSDVFRLPLLDPDADLADSRHRLRPQLVAAVALAAVAAVVLAALAVVGWPAGHRSANPAKPSPNSSGYLGPGQTGTRDQVPWSRVGAGWRLLQPLNPTSTDPSTRTTRFLYLYDPSDGRYLITDQLPAGAWVLDWSPDGARALVETFEKSRVFLQLQLRTGAVVSSAALPDSAGLKYADARGSAVIVRTPQGELRRYGMDGKLQHRYPSTGPNGVDGGSGALRTDDGAGTVVQSVAGGTMLLSEAGALVRRYPLPDHKAGCHPIQLWGDGFLEACSSSTEPGKPGLYVQPLSGGSARLLIDRAGLSGTGYISAWQLSNGDVLLRNLGGSTGGPCVDENYALLHPDGTLTALRLPASIAPVALIFNVDRDIATFMPGNRPCYDPNAPYQRKELVDYNLVTGQTVTLPAEDAQIVNYPSDGQVQLH